MRLFTFLSALRDAFDVICVSEAADLRVIAYFFRGRSEGIYVITDGRSRGRVRVRREDSGNVAGRLKWTTEAVTYGRRVM